MSRSGALDFYRYITWYERITKRGSSPVEYARSRRRKRRKKKS